MWLNIKLGRQVQRQVIRDDEKMEVIGCGDWREGGNLRWRVRYTDRLYWSDRLKPTSSRTSCIAHASLITASAHSYGLQQQQQLRVCGNHTYTRAVCGSLDDEALFNLRGRCINAGNSSVSLLSKQGWVRGTEAIIKHWRPLSTYQRIPRRDETRRTTI